jgi:hypothetical protein
MLKCGLRIGVVSSREVLETSLRLRLEALGLPAGFEAVLVRAVVGNERAHLEKRRSELVYSASADPKIRILKASRSDHYPKATATLEAPHNTNFEKRDSVVSWLMCFKLEEE